MENINKILVTGAKGFLGKNLVVELKNRGYENIFEYDLDTEKPLLNHFTKECDFVFHLAGVNRPRDDREFMEGNFGFTSELLSLLKANNNSAPVLVSSSIHADKDNPYGLSKKAGEEVIFEYGRVTGSKVYVYRLKNLFGKWSRSNYNSVVSTFCYNIAYDLDIKINDPDFEITLSYIDDVVKAFINAMKVVPSKLGNFCIIPEEYRITLGNLAKLLYSFRDSRNSLEIPDMSDEFTTKLYSTYLSYLPDEGFSYSLKMNIDSRGSFTEFIKTNERGQVSVNVSKPGITKGNHWHHTKNEKFLVVNGSGIIRFRKIDSGKVIEYNVSGEKLEVVDIPPGYTHNIENSGDTDMVTIMWASECFDPEKPDTYYMEV